MNVQDTLFTIIIIRIIQWNLWYKTPQFQRKKRFYNGSGLILEVIFSLIKHFLFDKTWSYNGGSLIPVGLRLEIPLYLS